MTNGLRPDFLIRLRALQAIEDFPKTELFFHLLRPADYPLAYKPSAVGASDDFREDIRHLDAISLLNKSQSSVVRGVAYSCVDPQNRPRVSLVQGPPGVLWYSLY
jgi:hypothetical protein